MRIAIYGAGAMGTVLGAFITKGGYAPDLITRNVAHVQGLKEKGASVVGMVEFNVKVSALTPTDMQGKYDVIFLMTKQRENECTAEFLKSYLADDGVVCTTQNGLPESSIESVIGKERTLGCAVSWGATFVGGGVAKLTSSKEKLTFALGCPYVYNPKVNDVKTILESMGKVEICNNFMGARWTKLIINGCFSTLSALTGLTFGQVSKKSAARKVAQALFHENVNVCISAGVKPDKIQGHDVVKLLNYNCKLKKAISYALFPLAMKNHKGLTSGMYYDLKSGKKCDMPFINGAIVRTAKEFCVPCPLNEKALQLCAAIESGETDISEQNLKAFSALL